MTMAMAEEPNRATGEFEQQFRQKFRIVYTTSSPFATLELTGRDGATVQIDGRIVRQDHLPSGEVQAGMEFVGVTEPVRHLLIDKMFGDPTQWEQSRPAHVGSGVMSSLRSMLQALTAPWQSTSTEHRRIPRIDAEMPCRLRTQGGSIHGTVKELASRGVEFTRAVEDHGYGLVTFFRVPGDFEVQLYQPKYHK